MTLKSRASHARIRRKRPLHSPGIEERPGAGYLTLFNPRTQALHNLNASASAVWWLCDGTRTVDQVATEIASLFGVTPETAGADVRNVVTGLLNEDLLG